MKIFSTPVFSPPDGAAGAATVAAGAAADTIAAGAAADTVAAGAAASTIAAGAGSDTIAAGAGRTALDGGADDTMQAGAADFPADWRERIAGTDTKKLDRLKRYTDVTALGTALIETQDALRAARGGKAPANTAAPEDAAELKTWRAERGVPDDATGYTVPDTVKEMVTEEDKPILSNFTERMHKANIPASAAAAALEFYFENRDQQLLAEAEQDKTQSIDTTVELKQLWGPEYKDNQIFAREMAKRLAPEGADWFLARLPDGRQLGNVPGVVKMMAELGRKELGDTRFAGDGNTSQTMSRIEELRAIMNTDIQKWNASPAMRSEYQQLLEAQDRAGKR